VIGGLELACPEKHQVTIDEAVMSLPVSRLNSENMVQSGSVK